MKTSYVFRGSQHPCVAMLFTRRIGLCQGTSEVFLIRSFGEIYGQHYVSHNAHALCHLAADTRHLGPLDWWSAFPFESYMATIKKLLQKPQFPLEQFSNRRAEKKYFCSREDVAVGSSPLLTDEHHRGPLCLSAREHSIKKWFFRRHYSWHRKEK